MIGGEGGRLAEFTHIIMDEVRELNTVSCVLSSSCLGLVLNIDMFKDS